MRVVVTSESRFARTSDGAIWTVHGPGATFFARYLAAFDEVRVVARVADVAAPPPEAVRVDADAISVWPAPHYVGPAQYLLRRRAVVASVRASAGDRDAVILRAPTVFGASLAQRCLRHGRPYALEVVSDPYDVFAPGAVRHPARPFLRTRETARLRTLCRHAAAVAYVTEHQLQRRYPPGPRSRSTFYSSIHLPPAAFVAEPRPVRRDAGAPLLVSVGALEQPYKGIDTLLHAVARLGPALPVRLIHVGDGRCRSDLERLCRRLGLTERVTFAGTLPAGPAVRHQLDRADLFVMPSRTEGLPKALIEAMARGLPAIGTTVGGIPELLAAEDLVPPDDPDRLAGALRAMLSDPDRMARAGARNHARAGGFDERALAGRRADFYRWVREAAERPSDATPRPQRREPVDERRPVRETAPSQLPTRPPRTLP
ncbi:glycosyltransferase [Micromonospora sp. NPDC049282]|uniref:glycosyltransferase n=1 Tax=Micromonospora sp. NPDC049282 TaxID=3364269 RepID=UPI003721D0F0